METNPKFFKFEYKSIPNEGNVVKGGHKHWLRGGMKIECAGPDEKCIFCTAEKSVIDRQSYLEGRIKTILEASISDKEQLKATKDLVRDAIWDGFNNGQWVKTLHHFMAGFELGHPIDANRN